MINRIAVALVLAILVTASACRPSAPTQSDWQSSAEQAVSDMVSEVATSRLTVDQALRERFVGRYAVVVLTYSEEAAGKAADTVSTLQPPPAAHPAYDELTGLLTDSTDAISAARIAVTDGDARESRQAVVGLTQVLAKLHRAEHQLQGSS